MADFASIVEGRAATGSALCLEWQRASVPVLCRFLKRGYPPAWSMGRNLVLSSGRRGVRWGETERERERLSRRLFRTLVETIRPASMPIACGTNRVKRISQKIRTRRTLSVYGYSDHLTMVVLWTYLFSRYEFSNLLFPILKLRTHLQSCFPYFNVWFCFLFILFSVNLTHILKSMQLLL